MTKTKIMLVVDEFYNPITKQQDKEERLYINDTPLHCGDLIEVLLPDGWQETRVEKGSNGSWYLCGLSAELNPVGLTARTTDKERYTPYT